MRTRVISFSIAAAMLGLTVTLAEAGAAVQAAMYTYSRSQGIFAGVSLAGTVIATRYKTNEKYYHKPVFPTDILAGDVAPPRS